MATPIQHLSVSILGLFPDRRLPGRCVLVLDAHHEHFETLPAALARAFMTDAQRAGLAIRTATASTRLNYAMLGNQVGHLHLHVMPRGGSEDTNPRVSAWELDEPEAPLGDELRDRLVQSIRDALDSLPAKPNGSSDA